MSGKAFIDHFSALEDPRQAWKVVYPLPEILLVVLCATLGGAEDFVEVARWGQRKLDFLRRLLPYERGIASHDTLNDVMNALPAPLFAECFTAWVESLREQAPDIVAIDGKTSRRSRAKGSDPLHLVSAWASRQRLVLGQEAVSEKSNEINAIPQLLARLELDGALVTIDAMGCQTEIARAIRGKGADYLLALKDNWPALAEEVRRYFDTAPADSLASHETTDGDHGRIEVRRAFVSHDVGWLASDRRFPGEWRFPDLAMIGMVEAEVERDARTSLARRYYLSSAPLTAPAFAAAVRAHWGIENRLHWVMDVVFHDDLMRLRTGSGPANMATIRHAALNIVKEIPDKASLKVRRKTLGWDDQYLLAALKPSPQ
ncbi:MAG: ISAs1 family transposase [Amaricoccus sp.]|uniref:ISAs1 family transposase n=1 Tax=Amaricoccus sp. TaxID=1872485 RepID=UPI0039E6A9F0